MSLTRHEPVYHAAHGCQAKALSLTATRLRGLFWACQVESQKNGGVLALVERDQHELEPLSCSACMLLLRMLKGGHLVALVMHPHGEDDPDPDVSKRSNRYAMAFAFSTLALVIGTGPCFTVCRLPGKLMQGIAQRFDTAHAPMRFGIHPALKEDRRCSSQPLQTASILIACAIIADFCQQSRGQAFACTRQAREELVILMSQKKGVDLLVILLDLLKQRQQLTHQRQHQTRFGAGCHRIGLQMGLLKPLDNLAGDRSRTGMFRLSEDLCDLLSRSGHRSLWRGIGLQEQQGALLLQFGKQLQGHRVIGFETSRELIDQPRLHPDQGILIAREQFELGNLLAIWREAMQIDQVRTSGLGQQVGVNRIGLGSRCGSPTIYGARIDRVDRPARFQQVSDQQTMRCLDDAGQLFFRLRTTDLLQKAFNLDMPCGLCSTRSVPI